MPEAVTHSLFPIETLETALGGGYQLLTPNIRLARSILAAWNARQQALGARVWEPLPALPLESWLSQTWERALGCGQVPAKVPLDAARAREIWLQVIAADRSAHGNYSLLQPGAAAELAESARNNLRLWLLDPRQGDLRREFQLDDDCAAFLRWLEAFEVRLAADGLATRVDTVSDLLASNYREPESRVALVNFDDLPPLYRAVVESVAGEHRMVETVAEDGAASSTIETLVFPEPGAELQQAARWAAQRYRQDPQATTAIILARMDSDRSPMEYLLRREFDCLGENYTSLPVNFSTGISLDKAPLVRDALRMLAMQEKSVALTDVLGLLQSRFAGHGEGNSERAANFMSRLLELGVDPVETGLLRYLALEAEGDGQKGLALGKCLKQGFELRLYREHHRPSAWIERFSQVLDIWGWPGPGPLDSLEYQQVETWYATLERCAGFDQVCGPVPMSEALHLIKECCQTQVSQPRTEGNSVQVLGPLEGAGLAFDAIWLLGMQGSRWPAPAQLTPFIPPTLQRQHDMPHSSSEREWTFANSLLRRFRAGCRQLVVSYSRQVDGITDLPSSLLPQADWLEMDLGETLPGPWREQWQARNLESVQDTTGGRVSAAELAQLRGGSAILADQANCPFRAFARRRLAAEPPGETRRGLTAAERGTILHHALYALWGELGDSARLERIGPMDLEATAARVAEAAIEAVPGLVRQVVGAHCLELERLRLAPLLLEWLTLERQRPPFQVIAREETLETQLAGLPLRLRIDRVDQLENGDRLVIDYKSGANNKVSDWLGVRPGQPQLPLYGITVNSVAGLAFAEVRPRDCKFKGIGSAEGVPGVTTDISRATKRHGAAEDWVGLRHEWQRSLENLAQAFMAGVAAVDPLPGACRYCGLDSLCRVGMREDEGDE